MFVQVVQGKVSDAAAAREHFDRWVSDLAPGATGWLGTTGGVTDDGTLVVLARFESEEDARRNSDRPEQSAWWAEVEKVFSGTPEFHDSTHVELDITDDPNKARFVQVMQGRTTDPTRARELMSDDSVDWTEFRPEILGSVSLEHDDDAWTMATYFTTEDEARAGEQKEPPPQLAKMIEELMSVSVGEPAYFDLRDPWLDTPGA